MPRSDAWPLAPGCVLAALVATLRAGCALSPAPTRDEAMMQSLPSTTRLPSTWMEPVDRAGVPGAWVRSFNDPQLDAVVAEAMAHNTDLRVAAARVEIAQQWVTVAGAGIGMSIPVHEGGALMAQVAIATAQQAQAVARYFGVMLNAFREVEDALASEALLAQRLPLDERSLQARVESVCIATVHYRAGQKDLLWVSQLQTQQIGAESDLIRLRSSQRANRIRLYHSLGGGFDSPPTAPALARAP